MIRIKLLAYFFKKNLQVLVSKNIKIVPLFIYLAISQPVFANSENAPNAAEKIIFPPSRLGEQLSLACMSCHNQASFYPIAGQNSTVLFEKISQFANDEDKKTIMHQLLKGYNNQELKAIAEYFAEQKPYDYKEGEKEFSALQNLSAFEKFQKIQKIKK